MIANFIIRYSNHRIRKWRRYCISMHFAALRCIVVRRLALQLLELGLQRVRGGAIAGGASRGLQDCLQLAASFEAFEGNVRCKPGSARFGRIIIGNSNAGVVACSDSAVNPAHWIVGELWALAV